VSAAARTRRYGVKTQLPRTWTVRTVLDVEAFCQEIIEATCRASAMPRLEPCDIAAAIGYLLGQVAILDGEFDDRVSAKPYLQFDLWLRSALRCDLIDFWRSPAGFGRHGQHRIAAIPDTDDHDDEWFVDQRDPLDADDAGASRLERVIAEFTVDPPDAGDVALRWVLTEGDRQAVQTLRGLGGDTGPGAQERARATDEFVHAVTERLAA
jgi:hypothetical protein